MRRYLCLIKNRKAQLNHLEDLLAEIEEQRKTKGRFWRIVFEKSLKSAISDKTREIESLVEDMRHNQEARNKFASLDKEEEAKRAAGRRMESAIDRFISKTLKERHKIGRQISAIEVDKHRCRVVFMECNFIKSKGMVEGFTSRVAFDKALEKVRKITAMPIKMRLTLEKMELKLLRRRIAATHDLA